MKMTDQPISRLASETESASDFPLTKAQDNSIFAYFDAACPAVLLNGNGILSPTVSRLMIF